MSPDLIAGGVQALGGLVGGAIGLIQRGEGRNKLRHLQRPDYEIPYEVQQAANEGLPSEQYAKAMQNINRQQLNALKAAKDRRGGLEAIGAIQQRTNDATLGLDAANAQARQQNQLRLAGYRDKAWDWNKKQKYQTDYNYAMNLLGAGNQNLVGGIDKLFAGGGLMAGSYLNNKYDGGAQTTGGY